MAPTLLVHAFVHILASVLVLPYVALAAMFLLIGEAARTKGPFELLDVAALHALWILQWGIFAVPAAWLVLASAGCFPPTRRPGAAVLALLALGSFATIVTLQQTPLDAGQWLFLAPCVVVAAASAWLFRRAGASG